MLLKFLAMPSARLKNESLAVEPKNRLLRCFSRQVSEIQGLKGYSECGHFVAFFVQYQVRVSKFKSWTL